MLIKAGNVSKVNLSVMEPEKRNGELVRGEKGKKEAEGEAEGKSKGKREGRRGRGEAGEENR